MEIRSHFKEKGSKASQRKFLRHHLPMPPQATLVNPILAGTAWTKSTWPETM
jgi:hypothetical protein